MGSNVLTSAGNMGITLLGTGTRFPLHKCWNHCKAGLREESLARNLSTWLSTCKWKHTVFSKRIASNILLVIQIGISQEQAGFEGLWGQSKEGFGSFLRTRCCWQDVPWFRLSTLSSSISCFCPLSKMLRMEVYFYKAACAHSSRIAQEEQCIIDQSNSVLLIMCKCQDML